MERSRPVRKGRAAVSPINQSVFPPSSSLKHLGLPQSPQAVTRPSRGFIILYDSQSSRFKASNCSVQQEGSAHSDTILKLFKVTYNTLNP
jgi:hypothetical protein